MLDQELDLLSIITITYNDLEGLRRTVANVSEQTARFEHIIVDGGSTDGTEAFLKSTHGLKWVSEPDRGRYHAMNKGIDLASGDAIWLMHAGDLFATNKSAQVGYSALSSSNANWAYGLSRVSRDGNVIEIRGAVPFRRTWFQVGRETIPHQAVIMKRDFIARMGGYNESFGLAEDQEFLMRAAIAQEPVVIPEILCDFDGSGAGSIRPPYYHYRDLWQARRRNSIVLGGSQLVDALLTVVCWLRAALPAKLSRSA